MSTLTIPTALDQLTPEWLTSALRESGVLKDASVTEASREVIGVGVGILGELARVTLTYDNAEAGAPKTVVAKLPTADPGGRGIGMAFGFYDKESRFYQELGRAAGLPAPRAYWSATDNATGEYFLLMEDLAGLRIGDQVEGCTVDEAKLIVGALAKFHAAWWETPKLKALDWIPEINAPVFQFVPLAYMGAIEPFLNLFGGGLSPHQEKLVRELGAKLPALQNSLAVGPVTLVHGDLRLDNVFYGSYDNSSAVTLIDWQIAAKSVGAYDVGYFLSQSIDPALRKANEEAILRGYHSQLVAGGVKEYSWDRCWDDYRRATLYCLVYPVIAGGSVDLANERGVALGKAMTDRCIAAIDDLNAAEFLKDL